MEDDLIKKIILAVIEICTEKDEEIDVLKSEFDNFRKELLLDVNSKANTHACSECKNVTATTDDDGTRGEVCVLQAELARRDEIIARLKEDGERLVSGYEQVSREAVPYCVVCKKDAFSGYLGQIKHDDWCPITLHRALMNELEED